jgi:hypothetical protein
VTVILVSEHGECVYEDLQLDLYDVVGWALVWLSPVPRPNAPKLST